MRNMTDTAGEFAAILDAVYQVRVDKLTKRFGREPTQEEIDADYRKTSGDFLKGLDSEDAEVSSYAAGLPGQFDVVVAVEDARIKLLDEIKGS